MLCSTKGTLCFSNQALALRHDVQLGDKNSVIMLFSSLHTFLTLLYKKIKRLTSYFRKKTYFLKKNRFLVQFLKHFYAFMIFLVIFSNL